MCLCDLTIQVHRDAPIEFTILLEHEDGKCSVVAVFLLLEKYLGSIVVVCFHCLLVLMEGHHAMPFPVLHDFNFTGDDLIAGSFYSVRSDILLGTYPSDDMDAASFLQFVEMLDEVTFPCDDTVPCRFDDCASVLCPEAVVGCDGEVGSFGVSEVLDVNAPDDAPDFNLIQLFHVG